MDVKISQNEKPNSPFTVFMDGLSFLNSHWQINRVNVWMGKCNASSLTLELKYLTNVTVENCTFGNWTFRQSNNSLSKTAKVLFSEIFLQHLTFTTHQVLSKI